MRKDELKDIKIKILLHDRIQHWNLQHIRICNYVSKQKYALLTSFTVGANYSVYIAFWMLGGQQFNHQYFYGIFSF